MSKDKKNRPMDITKIDLEKSRDKIADLPALLEYAHTVGGFAIVPTKEGAIKSKAMNAMTEQTSDQMDMIFEQMKVLATQAKELQDRVELSHDVYGAKIKFTPEIGQTYYLYETQAQEKTLSLIAPDEWGESKSFKAPIAKMKLLSDHTWKVIERYDSL